MNKLKNMGMPLASCALLAVFAGAAAAQQADTAAVQAQPAVEVSTQAAAAEDPALQAKIRELRGQLRQEFKKKREGTPEEARLFRERALKFAVELNNLLPRRTQVPLMDNERFEMHQFIYARPLMAVKILSIELEICPSTEAYRYRAQAEGMMGNLDGAEADLTAAIKLAPQGELFFQRGHLYLRRHDYDKAVQDFTQAIKLDGLPPGYHARAMAYFAKDDYAGAAEDLAQFFKLNTDKEFSASIARSRVCKGLHKHGFDVEGCEKPARGEGRQ